LPADLVSHLFRISKYFKNTFMIFFAANYFRIDCPKLGIVCLTKVAFIYAWRRTEKPTTLF
jgi:hypothetical protein